MVLLIDVGNSNIVLGLAEDGQIQKTFRLKSVLSKTSDEYYFQIRPILEAYPIQDIIISSVVPIITSALKKFLSIITEQHRSSWDPELKPVFN